MSETRVNQKLKDNKHSADTSDSESDIMSVSGETLSVSDGEQERTVIAVYEEGEDEEQDLEENQEESETPRGRRTRRDIDYSQLAKTGKTNPKKADNSKKKVQARKAKAGKEEDKEGERKEMDKKEDDRPKENTKEPSPTKKEQSKNEKDHGQDKKDKETDKEKRTDEEGTGTQNELAQTKKLLKDERQKTWQLLKDVDIERKRNTTLNKQVTDLKKENDRLKAQNKQLTTKVNDLTESETNLRVQLVQTRHRLPSNHDNTDAATKLAEMTKQYDSLLQKVHNITVGQEIKVKHKEDESEQEQEATRPKALLIVDSNRKHMVEHLDNEAVDWSHTEKVYTVDHLEAFIKEEKTHIEQYDIVVVMEGTNNVRKNAEAITTVNKLLRLMENISRDTGGNVTPIVMQIPPLGKKYSSEVRMERKVFNTFLRNSKLICIETEKVYEGKEEDVILEKDDLHITPQAAKLLALEVNKTIKNMEKRSVVKPSQIKEMKTFVHVTMKIPKDYMKHIVGVKGAQIEAMESAHKVKISTCGKDHMPVKSVVIVGRREAAFGAAEDISEIIDRVRKNTTCRFFLTNSCNKGEDCKYKHSDMAKEQEESRKRKGKDERDYRNQEKVSDKNHPRRESREQWRDQSKPRWHERERHREQSYSRTDEHRERYHQRFRSRSPTRQEEKRHRNNPKDRHEEMSYRNNTNDRWQRQTSRTESQQERDNQNRHYHTHTQRDESHRNPRRANWLEDERR